MLCQDQKRMVQSLMVIVIQQLQGVDGHCNFMTATLLRHEREEECNFKIVTAIRIKEKRLKRRVIAIPVLFQKNDLGNFGKKTQGERLQKPTMLAEKEK
jgi:hypothetical protein